MFLHTKLRGEVKVEDKGLGAVNIWDGCRGSHGNECDLPAECVE